MTEENPDQISKNDYVMLHRRCAICHWPMERRGRTLEVHHIVGGPGRKDIVENWCLTCRRCHTAIHQKLPEYGTIPKGAVLTAKYEEDGYFDPSILAALKHRKALPYELCEIPEKFLQDRERGGGDPWP
jgi:hypothetical protein